MECTKKVYLRLAIYNYDASPRYQSVKFFCVSEEAAQRYAKPIKLLIGLKFSDNNTREWLQNHFAIDGFIERIDGLFVEITTQMSIEN